MQEEKPRKLDERTVDYGLAVIGYCEGLPRSFSGRHISDQLLRSATSVESLRQEAHELTLMISSSIATALRRAR